ncbi:IS110 family transposase [Roseibium sp.]|uniref:IS110 family transposase n=1 Tax=Roseibium sp. TaxID=1936156 RepID=UPI003B502510
MPNQPIEGIRAQILNLEMKLRTWHRNNEARQLLAAVRGFGVITATALVGTIEDATQFHSGRQLVSWLGLVPRQYSSGGKERLDRISKRGNVYLRKLLVHGARTALTWSRRKKETRSQWLDALLARRPTDVVLIAKANKTARTLWAMLSRDEAFETSHRAIA